MRAKIEEIIEKNFQKLKGCNGDKISDSLLDNLKDLTRKLTEIGEKPQIVYDEIVFFYDYKTGEIKSFGLPILPEINYLFKEGFLKKGTIKTYYKPEFIIKEKGKLKIIEAEKYKIFDYILDIETNEEIKKVLTKSFDKFNLLF